MVILITGKKDSGKTYYAMQLEKELLEKKYKVVRIDGDEFREKTNNQDYSDEGRLRNLLAAAREAADLERGGHIVLVSFIAPRKKWRNAMRAHWRWSRLVYMPGGTLWEGTTYETPDFDEMDLVLNKLNV